MDCLANMLLIQGDPFTVCKLFEDRFLGKTYHEQPRTAPLAPHRVAILQKLLPLLARMAVCTHRRRMKQARSSDAVAVAVIVVVQAVVVGFGCPKKLARTRLKGPIGLLPSNSFERRSGNVVIR